MANTKIDAVHALNARIASLDEEMAIAAAEIDMLRHIDDDARRDALVTDNADDRQVARMTRRDVERAERYLEKLRRNRSSLVKKRDRAIAKIARG